MKLEIQHNKALPHLANTALYALYQSDFPLKQGAINVLVGPNGSGKTTFLEALAFLNLTYYYGQSRVCKSYLDSEHWEPTDEKLKNDWGLKRHFAYGLKCDWPFMPALSYFPKRIPGREDSIVAAMMTGYFDEAREYGHQVDNKSSGQANWSQLDWILTQMQDPKFVPAVLNSEALKLYPYEQEELKKGYGVNRTTAYRKSQLGDCVFNASTTQMLVLLDEPEQSLDMLAQLSLWERLKKVHNPNRTFVIATHSPLVLNQDFHLIETQKGYLNALAGAAACA